MAYHLGIDGGGSGCRAVLADAAGQVIGHGAAGPANIASDPDGALCNILAAAAGAMADAGVGRAATSGIVACLGLAGANAAGAAERLRAGLPFLRARIVSDAVTACVGALGDADGVVAAIGTGSVFAMRLRGEIRQIGGKGLILGDEGSGAWLGRALLSHALRAADGHSVPGMTPLLSAVLADMGGEDGIVGWAARATPSDFAALMPRLVTGQADPAARHILVEGSDHVTRALGLLLADHPAHSREAVFLGGLGPLYAGLLAPGWGALPPKGTALDGALILALAT